MPPRVPHLAFARALAVACLGGLVVAACSGRAPAPAGGAAAASVRPAEADPIAALSLGHEEVWRRVGPHQFQAKSRLQVTVEGQEPDLLEEEYVLAAGTAGAYHARYENSHDQGREVVFQGGDLYVRPRYGTFVRRRPDEGEAERLRQETYGGLAAALEVVGRFVQAKAEGPATVAGRPARRLALGLTPTPRAATPAPEPRREWRATVAVQKLAGTLSVDEQTGAPLACSLKAEYTFRRGAATASATLEYEGSLTPAAQVAVTAPAHVPQPVRTRYTSERRELLKGLVGPGAASP
jgi:hypothetical protein